MGASRNTWPLAIALALGLVGTAVLARPASFAVAPPPRFASGAVTGNFLFLDTAEAVTRYCKARGVETFAGRSAYLTDCYVPQDNLIVFFVPPGDHGTLADIMRHLLGHARGWVH